MQHMVQMRGYEANAHLVVRASLGLHHDLHVRRATVILLTRAAAGREGGGGGKRYDG
jgi:hypothetical protein